MDSLKVGDHVMYKGGRYSPTKHKGEVGKITAINEWYGKMFISMDLLTPKETYYSPTAKSTIVAVTAPFKYFKRWEHEWEV